MKFETALVTGGTTGIGEALVRALIAEGTRVAICARNKERLDDLVAELGADRLIGIQADVSDPERARQVVAEAEEKLGGLDLVIANAGRGYNVRGPKMTVDSITQVLQLNVMGACATVAAAVGPMVSRGRGHIVGISSIAGTRGMPTSAAYCASKAAFSTFLESLRIDLRKTGVAVIDIRPGFVDTPLTQKNKFGMPFIMPADRAAQLILAATKKKRGVYSFPWPMAIGAWFLRHMPSRLYEFVAGRLPL